MIAQTVDQQRQKIEQLLDTLPEESLPEVVNFLQYLAFKRRQPVTGPYQVVDQFEGIWEGYEITEDDIVEARQKLWGNFGNRDI